jgi:hypothetical protein
MTGVFLVQFRRPPHLDGQICGYSGFTVTSLSVF